MTRDAIAIAHLSKRFGKVCAVDDLTLSVPEGSICGLLGPNGAGKTTTFKCLLGLAKADAGQVSYWGRPFSYHVFTDVAYVPEQSTLYEWMKAQDYLEFTRRAHRSYDPALAQTLLALLDLDARKRVRALSKGQRTALMVVMALARRPRLLILDEPTSGLDPIHQRQVLDLIIEAAAGGATVLFSSHQITQVERAADHVSILKNGRLIVSDSVDALKEQQKVIEAIFEGEVPSINGLTHDPRVRRIEQAGHTLRVYVLHSATSIARDIDAMKPASVSLIDRNLEDIFMDSVTAGSPATVR
jgi:ABC-2 type transport system ATP-binding protein